jgi:protease-4
MSEENVRGAAAARPGRRRTWWWVGGVLAALVVVWSVGVCVLVWISSGRSERNVSLGGDAVAAIYVEGSIGLGSPGTGSGVVASEIIEYIRQAEETRRIKATVVYINSPGGTVVPSDEMYQALRAAEKPVVAAMGDVAASGGYYIACGADKILAHPATITGSIGVYGQLINAADLLDRLGVEGIIIRSGSSKAVGNWFEHPTEEQISIEQAIVDELNDMFISAVATGRGMEEEAVRQLADGRPYTGQQALDLGLIDQLGSMSDAIAVAAELADIDGDPAVIEYRRTPSLLEVWLASQHTSRSEVALLEWLGAQFPVPQMRYLGP